MLSAFPSLRFVWLVLLTLVSPAPAQEPSSAAPDAGPWVLPARIVRDYFLVPVCLDGREDRTLWMLYDTGASHTVIDPQSLASVSDWEPGGNRRVSLVMATIGPATLRDHSARVRDLDHIAEALGYPIDGILGYTAFAGLLLTLDYPDGEMRLARGTLPEPNGVSIFPITRRETRRPFVAMDCAGRTEEVLIDSGSGSGFVLEDRRGRDWLGTPQHAGVTVGINGPQAEKTGRLAGEINFLGRRFLQPTLRLTSGTELVGTQVLQHFALTFDITKRRLLVEADGREPVPPRAVWGTGVQKSPDAGAHRVHFVVEGSPGERAGVRKGDRIIEVNGVPHAERGAEKLLPFVDGERRYFQMVIERDGQRLPLLEVERGPILPLPAGANEPPPRLTVPRELVQRLRAASAPAADQEDTPLSPDGWRTVHVLSTEQGTRLQVRDPAGRVVANPVLRGDNHHPIWSADGRWLGFWRREQRGDATVWSAWAVPANGSQLPEALEAR